MQAKRFIVSGKVQGVGFRPFIYRIAHQHQLTGWVKNKTGQVEIIIQGQPQHLQAFEQDLIQYPPPLSEAKILSAESCPCEDFTEFSILKSQKTARPDIHIPADFFTCQECLDELLDKNNRRYRYPFINCTQCGPRYTLIESLPYDRPNTSMKSFPLCEPCNTEYTNPLDRRFHAQPVACEDCGPVLSFNDQQDEITGNSMSLSACISALENGDIIAVKGIGGYHLMCDALNPQTVQKLRDRKQRPDKPFAVLFPWQGDKGLDSVLDYLDASEQEQQQLTHASRPVVLINAKNDGKLPDNINPGLDEVGAMLPYSPLHFLISHDFNKPLIATSANFTGEPVITDNQQAQQRLGDIADAYLHHNRPILRPADDSVVRVINNRPQAIRLGRGIAPLELDLPFKLKHPLLAVGGHMKNTIALAWDNRIVISPHIGDLSSVRSMDVFQQVIMDLQNLYNVHPDHLLCDRHPDYASSRWAKTFAAQQNKSLTEIYHHHAHASSLCGEYPEHDRWLCFTWDGTGYGADGTIWGGEALLGDAGEWQQVASFKPLKLLGGDKASLQPWRSAAAMMWPSDLSWSPKHKDVELARQAYTKDLSCVTTSAVGRLFDAASALIQQRYDCSFDGQAPMQLEQISAPLDSRLAIDLDINIENNQQKLLTNWQPLTKLLIDESISVQQRSAIFHSTLAMNLVAQAKRLKQIHGHFVIGLSGGVFQNRLLTEFTCQQLKQHGFDVYTTQHIPCNDAGISYGQVIDAHQDHIE